MKLKKCKKNKKVKKIGIGSVIGILLLIGGITLYKTFALYEEKKEFDVLRGKIGEFVENDLELAMTVDGNHTNEVPSKGKYYVEVTCDNGAEGRWDYDAWTVVVGNMTKTKVKCMIEFKSPGTLMATTPNNTSAFWGHKESITRIVFENRIKPYANASYTYDVSDTQDGSVMSYMVANESDTSTFTLYIQGNGGVTANTNSSYLFYSFNNLEKIENLHLLNTSNSTNISYMFRDCIKLVQLDVSSFNTEQVKFMAEVFSMPTDGSGKLEEIVGLEYWNTENVVNMASLFSELRQIKSLDGIGNWDISNVSNIQSMFQNDRLLESLDLHNWNTSQNTSMTWTFGGCVNLKYLDISKFSINNVLKFGHSFYAMPKDVKIKTNTTMKNWIMNLEVISERPSEWNDNNFIIN